jgi:hypothetical protein
VVKVREHGERAKYVVEKCRCGLCRASTREYERQRTRDKAMERWGMKEPRLVDSTPAREHLARLAEYGIGWKHAADLAGVSRTVVGRLRGYNSGRPANRVRPETLRRILAVEASPRTANPGALVDALGSGRKLRSLVALGWTRSELGRRIGVTPQNIGPLMVLEPGMRITARRWCQIDDLWRDLCMTVGPSVRAAADAKRLGWAPPLAWDDIDDPCEVLRDGPAERCPSTIEALGVVGECERPRRHRGLHRDQILSWDGA